MKRIVPVLLLGILAGCASAPQSESGNFGSCIAGAVEHYGGRTVTSKSLPAIRAKWTTESTDNEFKVSLNATNYPAVDAFLRKAYGDPISAETNSDGSIASLYRTVGSEVDIAIVREGNAMTVTCLPGIKKRGQASDHIPVVPEYNAWSDDNN